MGLFKMNQKEIDNKLKQIEGQYKEFASIYGDSYFNIGAFKNRYLDILSVKGNLEMFISSELKLIQDMVKTIEIKKQNYLSSKESTMNSIETMANNIVAQLTNYPELDLGARASLEMKKLAGTCQVIYPKLEPFKSFVVIKNHTIYSQALNIIKDLAVEPYGPNYKNYLDIINNALIPISKSEIFAQKILKDVGIALKTMLNIIEISSYKSDFKVIVDYVNQMIIDFRLDIFEARNIN